ncbi:transaldolase family protein [Georgenia sp. SUBG003]|uniref:transaldolase family protein n=1 Tax=Georgenia sp. SUBG003 TaxID=1497974 RepID=UPI000693F02B
MLDLFLDTADLDAARPLLATGVFAGVTTNPTLLARAGVTTAGLPELVDRLREAGAGTLFVQTWGATTEEMLRHAREVREASGDVGIKIPANAAGIATTRTLADQGVTTLVTAVYNHVQVLPAIAAGATFVAPYVGRMTDNGRDGVGEVLMMQRIIDGLGSPTRLLVASLRAAGDVARLAEGGVDCFTIAPPMWEQLLAEPLTTEAVRVFDDDVARTLAAATDS